jgi:hypothetical protein
MPKLVYLISIIILTIVIFKIIKELKATKTHVLTLKNGNWVQSTQSWSITPNQLIFSIHDKIRQFISVVVLGNVIEYYTPHTRLEIKIFSISKESLTLDLMEHFWMTTEDKSKFFKYFKNRVNAFIKQVGSKVYKNGSISFLTYHNGRLRHIGGLFFLVNDKTIYGLMSPNCTNMSENLRESHRLLCDWRKNKCRHKRTKQQDNVMTRVPPKSPKMISTTSPTNEIIRARHAHDSSNPGKKSQKQRINKYHYEGTHHTEMLASLMFLEKLIERPTKVEYFYFGTSGEICKICEGFILDTMNFIEDCLNVELDYENINAR